MRRNRRAVMTAAVLAASLLFGACGDGAAGAGDKGAREPLHTEVEGTAEPAGTEKESGEENAAGAAENTESADAAAAVTTYPVTVVDQLGRTVVIEKEPETIVSGYYISSSFFIALGMKDRLVGIEAKADVRPIYGLAAPELLKLPNVGTAKEFDLEGCAALQPDLVVVPAKLKETIPAMEELGMTVIAVNPEDRALYREMAEIIGTAVNAKERAKALVESTDGQLAALSENLAGQETPRVYLAGNSSFLSTAGGAMYQNSLIGQAGGANVAAELSDSYWAEISYEQLIAWDPEYIILAAEADYTAETVLSDPQLAECAAVKNGQVYQIPNTVEAWDSPVPGSAFGTLWLASVLHPDCFSPEQYRQAATEFYEEFYGFAPAL